MKKLYILLLFSVLYTSSAFQNLNDLKFTFPSFESINSFISASDAAKLDEAVEQNQLANKMLDEVEEIWIEVRNNLQNATTDSEESEANQLKEDALEIEKEAFILLEKSNSTAYNILSANLESVQSNFVGNIDEENIAQQYIASANDYYSEAISTRRNMSESEDQSQTNSVLFTACELEIKAIKKLVEAYGIFLRLDYVQDESLSGSSEEFDVDFTEIDYAEVDYSDGDYYAVIENAVFTLDDESFEQTSESLSNNSETQTVQENTGYYTNDEINMDDSNYTTSNSGVDNGHEDGITNSGSKERPYYWNIGPIPNVEFKVQIAADNVEVPETKLHQIYKGDSIIYHIRNRHGWYKYSIGTFDTYIKAARLRDDCGVKGAFVVAYRNRKKVELKILQQEK